MEIPSLNHHVGSTERVYIAHVNDLNGLSTFVGIVFWEDLRRFLSSTSHR